jgi:hypothetical protein
MVSVCHVVCKTRYCNLLKCDDGRQKRSRGIRKLHTKEWNEKFAKKCASSKNCQARPSCPYEAGVLPGSPTLCVCRQFISRRPRAKEQLAKCCILPHSYEESHFLLSSVFWVSSWDSNSFIVSYISASEFLKY